MLQVYDVTNRESFTKVENWLNELETYSTNHDIVKMLVGNKVCATEDRFKKCKSLYSAANVGNVASFYASHTFLNYQ